MLFDHTRKISSKEFIYDDLQDLKTVLTNNGYPLRFLGKYRTSPPQINVPSTVPQKKVYINLLFKGGDITEQIIRHLTKSLKQTFNAA